MEVMAYLIYMIEKSIGVPIDVSAFRNALFNKHYS